MASPSIEAGHHQTEPTHQRSSSLSSSSSSSSSSDQEFQNLRISAQEENSKTYQQRLQDIFGDAHQHPSDLSTQSNQTDPTRTRPIPNGTILSSGHSHKAGIELQDQRDDDPANLEPVARLDDEDDEDEFIYDGKDVTLFDDEDQDDLGKDYAVRLDEILGADQSHHQLPNSSASHTTPDNQFISPSLDHRPHHQLVEPDQSPSSIEQTNGLAESKLSSSTNLPITPKTSQPFSSDSPNMNHRIDADIRLLPSVVIPPDDSSQISSPSTSISQRIPFNQQYSSITPSQSITGSNTSSNLWFTSKMRPHSAQFSRLRSLCSPASTINSPSSLQLPNKRCVSSSTLASDHAFDDRLSNLRSQSEQPQSPSPSILDRYPSPYSNGHHTPSVILESDQQQISSSGIFRWASLRRISQKIYSIPKTLHPTTIVSSTNSTSNTLLGLPTVIATSGVIVVGTAKGWVMVFDYASNLKCVLGSDAVVRDAGSVSALSISHDHTFVAVGHIMGHIYLYDLAKPKTPSRTVTPTSLKLVQDGRSEGHLLGNKIIHVDFIGLRHTAIISADETGLAFYHALGQVLGLASTDVIRILGKYPDNGVSSGPNNNPIKSNLIIDSPNSTTGHSRHFSDASVTSLLIGGPKSRKTTKIFGALPLPLGPTPHPTDHHGLVALLTSSKLIIIALKPTPRTCWRSMRNASDLNQTGIVGSLSWFPSATVKDPSESKKKTESIQNRSDPKSSTLKNRNNSNPIGPGIGMDPLLAFSWGKIIRFVTVIPDRITGQPLSSYQEDHLTKDSFLKGFARRLDGNFSNLRFVEGKSWTCSSNVLAIQWLSWRIICVLTSTHFEVIDTQIWQRTGFEPLDLRRVVRLNVFPENGLHKSNPPLKPNSTPPTRLPFSTLEPDQMAGGSVIGSFKAYKGKIFLLTTDDLRLGIVISWADQILELVETGSLTEAIELTTSYWFGRADLETIGLPSQESIRKSIVKPKLIEIMRASLEYVFSDRRMEDDTHFDLEGRGVDRTALFEGLVRSCTKACIAIDELDFIFDEMYEQYQEHGIQNIFFLQIEPFILRSELSSLPTAIAQGLISLHEERKEFDQIEQIIRHVDPTCLDINQVLAICSRELLNDALVYVYTEALNDFVGPIVEFLNLIKTIHSYRQRIQQYCEDSGPINEESITDPTQKTEDRIEKLVPIAYKIFPYLSAVLSGLSYPNKVRYAFSKASRARFEVYQFIFSGKSMHWPQPDGKLILTTDDGQQEPTYPYLRTLLMLDSEAMLDTLDIAFEDSWLHEFSDRDSEKQPISRQLIVNLLLEVISGHPEFSPADRTFAYIFMARNLPKYSQFLSLPSSTLHSILISLSTDDDRSTTEDRQLAVEFLLSIYTPPDVENGTGELLELFKEAGFWRILTSTYTQKEMWVEVVESYLKDPDLGFQIFHHLTQTFPKVLNPSNSIPMGHEPIEAKVMEVLLNSINQLAEMSMPETASLIEKFRPQVHLEVVDCLNEKLKKFTYLQALLEPSERDRNQDAPTLRDPSLISNTTKLDTAIRLRYISLLSELNPNHVLDYLQSVPPLLDQTSEIVTVCRHNRVFDGVIWQLDQAGRTRAAFEEFDGILKSTSSFIPRMISNHDNVHESESKSLGESIQSHVAQLTRCAIIAAEICVERTKKHQDGLTGEDCWFYLLSSIIQCIQTCTSGLPPSSPPESSSTTNNRCSHLAHVNPDWLNEELFFDDPTEIKTQALKELQELLPTVVSLLISRTKFSSQISFSNLVRRLIEFSSTSDVASKTSSQEFRSIILMIMDTYRFEGNVLEVTGRLIDEDLFEHVDKLAKAKEKGIRPIELKCFKCRKPIILPNHPQQSSIELDFDDHELGEGDDHENPHRLKLIKKLGLPIKSVTPFRKQSIKGKEVEQPFNASSSTSFSPSTFNNHHHQNSNYLNQSHPFDFSQDSSLADSFLNRNPTPTRQHLFNQPSSSFLLGPPPRAFTIHNHAGPSSPTPSPSRITAPKLSPSSSSQLPLSINSTSTTMTNHRISHPKLDRYDPLEPKTPPAIPIETEQEVSTNGSRQKLSVLIDDHDTNRSSGLNKSHLNDGFPPNMSHNPSYDSNQTMNSLDYYDRHSIDQIKTLNNKVEHLNQTEDRGLKESIINGEDQSHRSHSTTPIEIKDRIDNKNQMHLNLHHQGSIVLIGDGTAFHFYCWKKLSSANSSSSNSSSSS